jgi:hypothetical protein
MATVQAPLRQPLQMLHNENVQLRGQLASLHSELKEAIALRRECLNLPEE